MLTNTERMLWLVAGGDTTTGLPALTNTKRMLWLAADRDTTTGLPVLTNTERMLWLVADGRRDRTELTYLNKKSGI